MKHIVRILLMFCRLENLRAIPLCDFFFHFAYAADCVFILECIIIVYLSTKKAINRCISTTKYMGRVQKNYGSLVEWPWLDMAWYGNDFCLKNKYIFV